MSIANSPAAGVGLLLARVVSVGTERIPHELAMGRVLAEDVRADRDSPAIDVSAMDGYSVRLSDLGGGSLPIAGEIRIGQRPPPQPEGAALRIVTGAPVPARADAVIRREDVKESPDTIVLLGAAKEVKPGANIRRRGENSKSGARVLEAGVEITPPVSGALASFGVASPLVHRRIRVGVLVTGDEVLGIGSKPEPWQLRDSNSAAVISMISRRAWMVGQVAGPAPDEPAALLAAFRKLLESCDAVIATGGVSMGDRDFVPQVARELGAEVVFHKIPQRPGKPIFGAFLPDGRPFFGLPGNPLSVMVTARRMVLPVLERVAGSVSPPHPAMLRIENPDERRLDLWWHRLVRVTGPGAATLVDVASSGDVVAAAGSDGFVELPPGQGGPGPWSYYPWAF